VGEIADMMLEGTLCQSCGELIGAGDGFPRLCPTCELYAGIDEINPGAVVLEVQTHKTCRKCGKRVKWDGLNDHIAAKHPTPLRR
jgi:ribosomal protein L32